MKHSLDERGASHLLLSFVTGQISFLHFQVVDIIPEVIMLLSSQGRLMSICADRHADASFPQVSKVMV